MVHYKALGSIGQPSHTTKKKIRKSGSKNAARSSIAVARILEEMVKSTLGPRGMSKILVDDKGDTIVTDDGATILEKVPVQNPIAKIIVDAAKTQDRGVGDGTTTMVIIIGELLKSAESLLDEKVHPTTIISGYKMASDKAIQLLNKMAIPIEFRDNSFLQKVAMTAMHNKGIGHTREHFANISVEAVKSIFERRKRAYFVDMDNIKVVKKAGKSLLETQLIKGMILEKAVLHPDMPRRMENPRIALLDCFLELRKNELNSEIQINSGQMRAFIDEETRVMMQWIEKIKATGANVVLCQKRIDKKMQSLLTKQNIMGVHEVKLRDMEKLAKATQGRIVHMLDNLKPEDLGTADLVVEQKVGDETITLIEGCKDPRSVSILIRAGSDNVAGEAEIALKDALRVVGDVVMKNKIVAGGGAIEMEIAKDLKNYARGVRGRNQLVIDSFANSLESIPRILAQSTGLNPIDVIAKLRLLHTEKKGLWFGVNVYSKQIEDMLASGIIEPVSVKEQAVRSATEVASMILRTGHVIVTPTEPQMFGRRKITV